MKRERTWVERYHAFDALIEEEAAAIKKEGSFRRDDDYHALRREALARMFSRFIEGNDVGMLLNAVGDALEDQNCHGAAHRVWSITGEVNGPSPVRDHVEVTER